MAYSHCLSVLPSVLECRRQAHRCCICSLCLEQVARVSCCDEETNLESRLVTMTGTGSPQQSGEQHKPLTRDFFFGIHWSRGNCLSDATSSSLRTNPPPCPPTHTHSHSKEQREMGLFGATSSSQPWKKGHPGLLPGGSVPPAPRPISPSRL